MRPRDLVELLALAAIWGAAFLFIRIGVPEFGVLALAGLRVMGAALVLLPLLAWRGEFGALRRHWKAIAVVGLTNSALPFVCFGYAALSISAGLSSIFNAASPLFGALIAWLWLKEKLTAPRVVGLAIGFAGVFGLVWSSAGTKTGDSASVLRAMAACLLAALGYGFSANFTKRRLAGVAPMAVAAGSQLAAALALAAPAVLFWPAGRPSASAWANLALLAVLCTGTAYVLYFRLIANTGPAKAITVTFLIPAFAVVWGAMFLDEALTLPMVLGCAVILAGTALAVGLLPRSTRASV